MPFDLYSKKIPEPDLRCGQDVTILYGECHEVKCGTAVGMICVWCRKEVAQFEWEEMERGMRVTGGCA